jgi:hypothetical protein
MACLVRLFPLLVVGCAGPMSDALGAFEEARYPAAAAEFRRLEPDTNEFDAGDFGRYALFRGLSHLALGDAVAADRWLSIAKQLSDDDAELFDDAERGRLMAAWRSMGRMPSEVIPSLTAAARSRGRAAPPRPTPTRDPRSGS